MRQTDEQLVTELLEKFTKQHYYCEDSWYSCPKHPEGTSREFSDPAACDCGADEYNKELQAFAEKLRQRLSH